MLYYLAEYLMKLGVPGAGMFTYVTFRGAFAAIIALVVAIWFGKRFIAILRSRQIQETQRNEKEDPFNCKKVGVPTMGGIVIIVAILVPVLLIGRLNNVYLILMIATTIILGVVGFVDDYIKTFKKNKEGLKGWYKVGTQVFLGLVIGLTLRYSPQVVVNEKVSMTIKDNTEVVVKTPDVKSTRTTIPFVKNHNLNYADLFSFLGERYKYGAAWIFFVVLVVFVVTAVSNGSNLNDGMDGMAAGNSAIIGVVIGVLAYVSSNIVAASHFNLMFVPGSEEVVVFMSAFVGALIGFLWYNFYPAQVFMGDTGSLTIGGIIAVSAIVIHKELLLPILCGVFLMESVSVIGQRTFYKMGKKKGVHQRVWKRTPIHDHYRTSLDLVQKLDPGCKVIFKGGKDCYHETKITLRFWIVTIGLAALTLLTLKIR